MSATEVSNTFISRLAERFQAANEAFMKVWEDYGVDAESFGPQQKRGKKSELSAILFNCSGRGNVEIFSHENFFSLTRSGLIESEYPDTVVLMEGDGIKVDGQSYHTNDIVVFGDHRYLLKVLPKGDER